MTKNDPVSEVEVSKDFIDMMQKSVWIVCPENAGYLEKRSRRWLLNKTTMFRNYGWHKKWVILHGDELVYMDKEPTADNINSLTIKKAHVTAKTTIYGEDDESHDPNSFMIAFHLENVHDWHFRASSKEEKMKWLKKISEVHAISIWIDDYDRVKILGVGGQGIVYELRDRHSGKHVAMKEIEIKSEKQMKLAVQEASLLKTIVETVNHPNLMQIEKVFQMGNKFYMVFPLCSGGELYDAVVARGVFTEHDAALLIRDVISALQALHDHDILHLDIKPENLLFTSQYPSEAKIILTDFGLSKLLKHNHDHDHDKAQLEGNDDNSGFNAAVFYERLTLFRETGELTFDNLSGTYGYMAPEIILLAYPSKAADIFATGVVLYILLCGYPPFYAKSLRTIFEKTLSGDLSSLETASEWQEVSSEAKDLVRRMLAIDPRERITSEEIAQHPWITQIHEDARIKALIVENDDAMSHYLANCHVEGLPGANSTNATVASTTAATNLSTVSNTSSGYGDSDPPLLPHTRQREDTLSAPPSLVAANGEMGGEGQQHHTPPMLLSPSTLSTSNAAPTALSASILPIPSSTSALTITLEQHHRHISKVMVISNLANHVQELKQQRMAMTMGQFMTGGAGTGTGATRGIKGGKDDVAVTAAGLATGSLAASHGKAIGYSHLSELYLVKKRDKEEKKRSSHIVEDEDDEEGMMENSPYDISQRVMMTDQEIRLTFMSVLFKQFSQQHYPIAEDGSSTSTINSSIKQSPVIVVDKLSVDQFLYMRNFLRHLDDNEHHDDAATATTATTAIDGGNSSGPSSSNSSPSFLNAGDLILFMTYDLDNDGMISLEDLQTAMVSMQKHDEVFMAAIFRIYTEAVWYLGQNVNYHHALNQLYQQQQQGQQAGQGQQQTLQPSSASIFGHRASHRLSYRPGQIAATIAANLQQQYHQHHHHGSSHHGGNAGTTLTLVEPPKYITAKNVSVVFEQLGYDPEDGQKVFQVLCEAIQRVKHISQKQFTSMSSSRQSKKKRMMLDTGNRLRLASDDIIHEEKETTAGTAIAAEGVEEEEGQEMYEDDDSDYEEDGLENEEQQQGMVDESGKSVDERLSSSEEGTAASNRFSLRAFAQSRKDKAAAAAAATATYQMDFHDFMQAVQLDSVLVQIFYRQIHVSIMGLLQRGQRLYQQQQKQPRTTTTATSLAEIFEEELVKAMNRAKGSSTGATMV